MSTENFEFIIKFFNISEDSLVFDSIWLITNMCSDDYHLYTLFNEIESLSRKIKEGLKDSFLRPIACYFLSYASDKIKTVETFKLLLDILPYAFESLNIQILENIKNSNFDCNSLNIIKYLSVFIYKMTTYANNNSLIKSIINKELINAVSNALCYILSVKVENTNENLDYKSFFKIVKALLSSLTNLSSCSENELIVSYNIKNL